MSKNIFSSIFISFLISCVAAPVFCAVKVHKPNRDHRSYRIITLPNQLQAVLVSDKDLKQTAVSLSVWVGYNSDPEDRPGLFHFMEHMLFLGTEKYPSSKAYGDYLNANGGTFNAFTSAEQTNYFFSVNTNAIDGALDRFSQFFIAPLFSETYVNREMHAVDSEHAKNQSSDSRRIYQVEKVTSNPKHPFSKFGTGNLETLSNKKGKKITDVLKDHFSTYYSANLMKIGMVGNQSLDEMEQQVRHYFSSIKNRNTKIPQNPVSPYTAEFLKKRVEIQPLQDVRRLRVFFPIPNQTKFYKEKPTAYLGRIIGYEGKGSLLSLLKKKNWATELSAGSNGGGIDFDTFGVTISLTAEGLNHQDEIIEMIFQTIKLIKEKGVKKIYFDEEKKLNQIRFEYVTKSSPLTYAKTLAIRLQEYPAQDILSMALLTKWNSQRIKNVLKRLNPNNMRVELTTKTAKTDKVERWYGTRFSITDISDETIERWKDVELNPHITLPAPNPFVPERVILSSIEKPLKKPEFIFKRPALTIWHKQDTQFESPKVEATFKLNSPVAVASPKTMLMTMLYTSLLKDNLNEYAYPALEAGLTYQVITSDSGLEIQLSGYPEKMPILFQTVIHQMKALKIDPQRFETVREDLKRSLDNHDLQESRSLTDYEFIFLLSRDGWHVNQLRKNIDSIDEKELQEFIPVLLSGITGRGMIYGNMVKNKALKLGKILEDGLIEDLQIPAITDQNRTVRLENNQHLLYQQQVKDVNSSIIHYYQYGPETIQARAIQGLMGSIISRPFYNQLRTKEQLGYVVYSSIANRNAVNGFQFTVQSSVKNPVYLQERIQHFLSTFEEQLNALPQEEFDVYREGLIRRLRLPTKNLKEQNMLYWRQIASQRYDFEEYERIAKALENVSKTDVINYYRKIFLNNSKTLTIQSFGSSHPIQKVKRGAMVIDPETFKQKSSYYGIATLEEIP